MIILECRQCKGSGRIPNEQFRICQELSPETRKYFHLRTDDAMDEDPEGQHDACQDIPEMVECPVCEGFGIITFDEDEWELRIVADEEETLET
ncbi:MAG: hypothetical protein HGA55_05200 [Methanoregulaceae archaeon]|nr:hypothetical protein [Methanoregulaceae archaeon]